MSTSLSSKVWEPGAMMISALNLGLEKTGCSSFIGEAVKGQASPSFLHYFRLKELNALPSFREVRALYSWLWIWLWLVSQTHLEIMFTLGIPWLYQVDTRRSPLQHSLFCECMCICGVHTCVPGGGTQQTLTIELSSHPSRQSTCFCFQIEHCNLAYLALKYSSRRRKPKWCDPLPTVARGQTWCQSRPSVLFETRSQVPCYTCQACWPMSFLDPLVPASQLHVRSAGVHSSGFTQVMRSSLSSACLQELHPWNHLPSSF